MKASSVLTLIAADPTRAVEVATRLHIPLFETNTAVQALPADTALAEECRTVATFLSENGGKFSVLSVSVAALTYPPTALMLSARTTVCFLGDAPCDLADVSLPSDASVDQIVGAWLSPELLSSFRGTK